MIEWYPTPDGLLAGNVMSEQFDHTWDFSAVMVYSGYSPARTKVNQLKSLVNWNTFRSERWECVRDRVNHPERYPNGFFCPSCEFGSLYDTGQMLRLNPNVLRVKCQKCNYRGERYE